MTENRETIAIIRPTEKAGAKTQLLLFFLVAYGVNFVMGLLLWHGSTLSIDTTPFPLAQMFYPAAGVMLAYLVTRRKDDLLPKWFFLCFLLATVAVLLCAVFSLFLPFGQPTANGLSMWPMISQYIGIGGTILCWITLLQAGKNRRTAYGLDWKHSKASLLCILLFFLLYLGRAVILYLAAGQAHMLITILQDSNTTSFLLTMPINFCFAFAPFFGEEYGWRYYLQPILQKRFGKRSGVLILGIVWGLWHIFLDFFYYSTPDKGWFMTLSQIIGCVTLGIFIAWAYLKTNNIWVPAILHFMNNNLSFVYAHLTQSQEMTWALMIISGILFGPFLLSKIFSTSSPT